MINSIKSTKLTKEQLEPFTEPLRKKSDRLMNYFLAGYFLAAILFSFQYHTFTMAISVSALCTAAYFITKKLLPKSNAYQYVLSLVFAVYMALFIYQMHGLFEMHFFAFIGCLILITYQNWKLQIPITLFVVVHHALFAYLQFKGSDVYFTELSGMSLATFGIHVALAAIIFGVSGLWAYNSRANTLKDAAKTLELARIQKELEESTGEELEKLALVASKTNNSVIITDKNGRIEWVNNAYTELTGYTFEESKGKRSGELLHGEETNVDTFAKMMEMLSTKESFTGDIVNYNKKRQPYWVNVNITPVLDENKEIVKFIAIQTDISDRKLNEEKLRISREDEDNRNWINEGVTKLNEIFKLDNGNLKKVCSGFLNYVIQYTGSLQGAVYLVKNGSNDLELAASYALSKEKLEHPILKTGEGLAGQAALDQQKKIITDPPAGYLKITSGLGDTNPKSIIVFPSIFENKTVAVLELASLKEYDAKEAAFLEKAVEMMALSLDVIERKIKTEKLLKETQILNQQLQIQEEELRVSNEELTEKSQLLQSSEEELRVQQEELMQTNTQLEEKAIELEKKNLDVKRKNEELYIVQNEISQKAKELEQTSKYKSEFLANMSHELRTPLNSILILSNLLAENKISNLTEKQLEYSKVIQRSGNDLLTLINDILDLSKIESGKVELINEKINFTEFKNDMVSLFDELAKSKEIEYKVVVDEHIKEEFYSDKMRVEQVLKNLLSNAFKFTPKKGEISLEIFNAEKNDFVKDSLKTSKSVLGFTVKDSGIGIPEEKQKIIFEAFKQADGSTNRKYGGTGLGLSISKELAHLLGGEIRLSSIPGKGSSFTIYLPTAIENVNENKPEFETVTIESEKEIIAAEVIEDKKLVLIVEDDEKYSETLKDYSISKGFRTLTESNGIKGLESIKKLVPDAIILDINLPGISGWEILKTIKEDEELKHIPVHIVSASDQESLGMQLGAVDFTKKPFDEKVLSHLFESISNLAGKETDKILIIEDDQNQFKSIRALLENNPVKCESAVTGKEALSMLKENIYQLIILDLSLPDANGIELIKEIKQIDKYADVPVIIYTGKSLSAAEEMELRKHASTIIIKTQSSYSRLTDEVNIFLNKISKGNNMDVMIPGVKLNGHSNNGHSNNGHSKNGYSKNGQSKNGHSKNGHTDTKVYKNLKDRKVLIVDDDMRNVFALSNLLENHEMNFIIANDGRESINMLNENPDTDLVLMDIMMPEMDGYEAMTEIRKDSKNKSLPIIALTAKAMKGDKEKCLSAGASDYISKPVDSEKLLSLIKEWLSK